MPVSLPGSVELVLGLLLQTAVPFLLALAMFATLTRNDADHRFAWTLAAFFAGFGNAGLGSIVVALLYYTVR